MFKVGDNVTIESYRCEDLKGLSGTIERTCYTQGETRFGVRIPSIPNPRSGFGIWWMSGDELSYCTEDNTNTEEEKFMLPGYSIAMVHFIQGENTDHNYAYALYPEDNCQVNDLVVVSTGHHGFAIAQIDSIESADKEIKSGRQIVCRCDFDNFHARLDNTARAADLKKAMDKRAKELQETTLYQLLAEKDPVMASLLGEYTDILTK